MSEPLALDFEAYVAAKKAAQKGGSGSEVGGASHRGPFPHAGRDPDHAYAYASDHTARATFERMKPVELAVEGSVRAFKQVWRSQLLGQSVKVSERQFPRIQAITRRCADTLGIPTPQVYIVNSPQLNAATYGTNEESFVMVHSALVDHYTDDELLTVIGHECGHIHNSHVVYLTALHYLTQVAGVFVRWAVQPAMIALRAWSRRAEITCDRAGMLCAKDSRTAERAITKLALGSRKLYEEFDLEAFLEQNAESNEGIGRFMEVFATHPWLPKRVLAMRAFAESEMYRGAAGLGTGGLAMDEVDERVRVLLLGDT
ncbi:MAG: M48 family metallopeptidase [Polyangiaceae bacterium]